MTRFEKMIKFKRHQQYVYRKWLKRNRKKKARASKKHVDMHNCIPVYKIPQPIVRPKFKIKKEVAASRYDELEIEVLLQFSDLFPNEKEPDIKDILSRFSRSMIINIAVTLNKLYGNASIDKIDMFFSKDSITKKEEVKTRLRKFFSNSKQNVNYTFCTYQTALELLRYAYSMPVQEKSQYEVDEAEYALFKVMLAINKQIVDYEIKKEKKNIPNLLYINNASNRNILKYDFDDLFLMQFYFSIKFFDFIRSKPEYDALYQAFLAKYNIQDWKQYVRTIMGLAIITNNEAGFLDKDLKNDVDNLMSKNVLDAISMHYNDTINYSSESPSDRDGNSDYRFFRDKPLIKISNGDYAVHNVGFLLERTYNSLYFDFMALAKESKIPGFASHFTSEFIEKTVFDGLMLEASDNQKYKILSEEDCDEIYTSKKNELGAPDFYLRNNDGQSALLFECKDIRPNGWIKEKRNFDMLEDELQNKILLKTWKYSQNEKVYLPKDKHQPIGIGQLVGHMKSIRDGNFRWDDLKKDIAVYPVLVIADKRIIAEGFSAITNQWYMDSLKENKISGSNNKPLIVVSLSTLLKYAKLFKRNGFEYYFEKYYKSIAAPVQNEIDAVNANITFDEFMNMYPFNLRDTLPELKKKLLPERSEDKQTLG
ncbi:hypothetical protein [Bacteroides fragilis]|nr:hypothetical protein [Bacteroides fragilis]